MNLLAILHIKDDKPGINHVRNTKQYNSVINREKELISILFLCQLNWKKYCFVIHISKY